jgi:acetyltransferase EpsM
VERIERLLIWATSGRASVDCLVGDGVHICPGVHLAGHIAIGAGAFIGVGAAVGDRIRIGRECVIGAGSALVDDVPDRMVEDGCPARIIRPLSDSPARASARWCVA